MYRKYTFEILDPIIKKSFSWAEVCRFLGVKPATGAQTHIKKVANKFRIDSSHFKGKAWNKGKISNKKKTLEEYLINDGRIIKSNILKNKLIEFGARERKCYKCQKTEWNGKKIPLELHHLNSNHFDNNLDNLVILCPNCHAQN